jgi:phosphonate transport system substrate-binding protein
MHTVGRLLQRFGLVAAVLAMAAVVAIGPVRAQDKPALRFAVGPFQPTPGDTRRAYEPFCQYLAAAVDRTCDLTVTTDWAGIAVALANNQADVAWMGPWGYVLAKDRGGAEAIATVKYQGKPTYHAIIIARPGLTIEKFPEDAKGMSISFADAGSTSGWLIPHYWFQQQGIDPRTFFRYRDGSSHAANVTAVATGQVDLATDYDRNLNAMIAKGVVKPDQVKVVWRSEPLPNDALAVRQGLDPALVARLREAALAIDETAAKTVMPANYTGWVAATPETYALIEKAGRALGKLGS